MSDTGLVPFGTILIAVVVVVLVYLVRKLQITRPKNLPPGPSPKPVIGSIGLIRGNGMERLQQVTKITESYGGLCTIFLGDVPHVFINDYETIKQVVHDDVFAGRPYTLRDHFFKRKGLLFTDGELWKEQRRFALSTLRDFGMGKAWLQDLILEEARELVQDLQATKTQPVNPTSYITPSVANVICAISYGKRFDHQDENFRRLTMLVGENIRLGAKMGLISIFPFLRLIPFSKLRKRFLKSLQNNRDITDFLHDLVMDHKSNLEGEPRDYIHAYLNEAKRQESNPCTTFTDEQLAMSIFNLFGAGTETTSTTLTWAIIYLLLNPDIYAEVQAEVDQVIPEGQFPTLDEKENLPYLQAVIMEVQRMANLVPFAGRSNTEQTTLQGYDIPLNTTIVPNLYAVHMNPKYFPEPNQFNPKRFLDSDGKVKQKVEGFLPFSAGKRFCLGESLAKMELFIFFASLLRHFNFKLPPGEAVSTSDAVLGTVLSPKPFKMIFEPRNV